MNQRDETERGRSRTTFSLSSHQTIVHRRDLGVWLYSELTMRDHILRRLQLASTIFAG